MIHLPSFSAIRRLIESTWTGQCKRRAVRDQGVRSRNHTTLCLERAGETSPMSKYWATEPGQEIFGVLMRNRPLSIFNARIFDSRVDRGIPSRAAAPEGPNTR